jgi:hypothetical protein
MENSALRSGKFTPQRQDTEWIPGCFGGEKNLCSRTESNAEPLLSHGFERRTSALAQNRKHGSSDRQDECWKTH